jgi:hypothetical protein
MKALRITLALLALAALAGCGDRALILRVDILSYLDEAAGTFRFGPVPAVPGGLASGEQTLVPDREVNLLAGLGDVADVQSVTFTLAAIARDSTGSGTDTMRVYMSGATAAPRATPPVLVLPFALVPGQVDTVRVTLDGDARVRALFAERTLRLEVTTSLRGPETGEPLNGSVRLDALDAVVVAKRSL